MTESNTRIATKPGTPHRTHTFGMMYAESTTAADRYRTSVDATNIAAAVRRTARDYRHPLPPSASPDEGPKTGDERLQKLVRRTADNY